mgnify:CR=1 FL=1
MEKAQLKAASTKRVTKKNTTKKIKYLVSNFQKIERDFAFIIDKKFEAEKIINILLNVDRKLIKKIREALWENKMRKKTKDNLIKIVVILFIAGMLISSFASAFLYF